MGILSKRSTLLLTSVTLLVHSSFSIADEKFDKLFNEQKYADAINYAEEQIPIGNRDASIWAKLGIANEGTGLVEKALACYMVAIRNDASNYEAHLGAARIYNKMNQPQSAVDMAQKASKIKSTGEANWEYARALLSLNKVKEAKEPLEKLLETDRNNAVANKELGNIYYGDKEFAKALPLLLITHKSQPNGETAEKIGSIYQKNSNIDSAIYFFKEAAKDKRFEQPELFKNLARMLFQKEQFKEAAELFERVDQVLLTGDDLYNYAFSMEKSDYEMIKVIATYEAADKKFGALNSKIALLGKEKIGRWKLVKKEFKEALAIFQLLMKTDASGKIVPDAVFFAAEAHEGLGEIAKAIPLLEMVIAKDNENIEAHARLADYYRKDGDNEKAQKLYERLLSINPNNPKVYMALGEYSIKAKKYEDALKYFQRGFNLDKNPKAAEGMMNAAWELKRFDLARDAAETALHHDSNLLEPQLVLAKINMQENNFTAAAKVLESLVKNDPKNVKFYKQLAICYEKTKNTSRLAEVDKEIIALDKKDTASRLRYASYLKDSGDLKTAFDILKELSLLKANDPDIIYQLFEVSLKIDKKEDAANYLQKFVQLKPADAKAQVALGNMLYEKKNNAAALAAYKKALVADPSIKGFYKKYAELVMAQEPPKKPLPKGQKSPEDEVIEVLTAAVKAGEADVEIYTTLGEIYQKKASFASSVDMYQKALQLDPKSFELLSALAKCQEKAGKVEDAILSYEQAVAMSASASNEYKSLGNLYLKQGKNAPGFNALKKYLEKNKDGAIALKVGTYEFGQKKYSEAVKYFGMVDGSDAKSAEFLAMYAKCAYETGDQNKAEEIFKQLVIAVPKNPEPFKTLFEIAKKRNDLKAASGYLSSYTTLKPDDATMLQTLGDMYFELKNNSGALSAYRAVLKINPSAKGFYKNYVKLANAEGNAEEKVRALSGAVAAGEADVAMYSELGESYKKTGNYSKAVQALEKATQLDPKNHQLLTSLADAQDKSGAVEMAIITYEQAIAMNPAADKEYKALGDLYMKQKKKESAVKSYKKYLEKNTDTKISRIIGEFALEKKDYQDAIKYFGMVTGAEADNADYLKAYGEACFGAKDDHKAYQIYKQLAVKLPNDAHVFKLLHQIAGKAGTKDESLEFLKKYTAIKPSDVEAQRTLGDMLYEKKDSKGALAAYRAVLKADSSAKGFYKKYAELVMAQEPPAKPVKGQKTLQEEIVEVLTAAVAAGEADVTMYRKLGKFYEKSNQNSKAVQMYEKASQLDPKDVSLLKDLANAQIKSKNVSGAILTFEQAIAMDPNAIEEYKYLGDLYKDQKKMDVAVKNYKKYLEKKKNNSLAIEVGSFAFNEKNYSDAVKYLGMVEGADAGNASFLKLYAEASYESKDDFKAYQVYKQLSVLTPQDVSIFKRLYEVATKAGTKDDVLMYLRKYTALKPTDVEAQKTLGNMLYEKKDSKGAIAAYAAVLAADPSAKGFYKNYADLLMSSGGTEVQIEAVLNGAISSGEADIAMYQYLGVFYQKKKNYVKAVQMYEKASQLDPKNVSLIADLAECQAKSGNSTAAILTYEQSTAMNPQASKEYKMLGDLYMQQKKEDVAIKNYKKYLEKNSDSRLASKVGEHELRNKNYNEAVKFLGMVSGAYADSSAHLKLYGEACRLAKDEVRAYQIYKKLAVATPKDADVFEVLYKMAEKAGTKDEGLSYLKSYTALRPTDADAQKTLGNILYEKNDGVSALAAYRSALKANPSIKGFYKNYVDLVIKEGNGTEIISAINGAVASGDATVDMYRRAGEIYRKQGNNGKAAQMYEKASQLDPKNAQLLVDLAQCQVASKDTGSAILTFEQAVAINPQAEKEYKALGDLYTGQKKSDAAVRVYKKYLEKAQDNQVAQLIAEYYMAQKNYTEAIKYFSMVTGGDAVEPKFLKMYAVTSLMAKDEFKAYQLYKQLSNISTKDPEVFEKLSDIATRAGTKDEVVNYLKSYTALKPSDAKAQKKLGDMLYERKDEKNALAAYRLALKADSTLKGFYSKYANLVINSGAEEEKEKALSGAIAAGEADARMYQTLGEIYKKKGLIAKAIPVYEKAAQLDPKNPNLLSELAECQLKKGAITEAIMTYEQVVAMNPRAENEYRNLGDLYMAQKKSGPAVTAYKKYLEKKPDDDAVAKIVGEVAFEAKNYSEAIKYLSMVKGNVAKSAGFLKTYGEAALGAKDYPRAAVIYKDLAALTPKDPTIYKQLYEVSKKSGATEDALTYLKKYTLFMPKDADALRNLGDALYEKKENAGALSAYSAALNVNPAIKGFYKNYVELVLASGTYNQKMFALNGAIKAGEADSKVYLTLGKMYMAPKTYGKAIEMFETASKLDPKNGELIGLLADAQMKNGDYSNAAITYEQALAMNPSAVEEYKLLGNLYMKQKKNDAAMSAYKKYVDKSPTDEEIASIVAEHSFAKKNYQDAFRYFSLVKKDNSAGFLAKYGMSAIEVKQFNKAIEILENLRSTTGANVAANGMAFKALAEAYEKNGDKKKAAEVLNDYVKIPGVNDPDASYKRAEVYETINSNLAVQMYEQNAIAYPKDYRNMLKLGIFHSRQSSSSKTAIKYLEKCAAITDTIARVWLELGGLYGKMRQDEQMLKAYRKFIEIEPENADATGKIGEILLSRNMTDDAMVFLEMANSLKPDDPKIMTLLARGYIMTNQRKEGAKIIEKVVRQVKDNVDDDLRMVLADVYIESGEYKKAIDELKIILSKKKDTAVVIKYAKVLFEMGKYSEASSALEEIKKKEPENLDILMMLGRINVTQKKYDDAIETYKEILYIDQNHAAALCERANVYMLQGKTQWAQTFYDRALKANANYAPIYLGLARIAKAQKDYALYDSNLEKARKLDPHNKEIQEELKSTKK